MSDPTLSDNDFKNKMGYVRTTLKQIKFLPFFCLIKMNLLWLFYISVISRKFVKNFFLQKINVCRLSVYCINTWFLTEYCFQSLRRQRWRISDLQFTLWRVRLTEDPSTTNPKTILELKKVLTSTNQPPKSYFTTRTYSMISLYEKLDSLDKG